MKSCKPFFVALGLAVACFFLLSPRAGLSYSIDTVTLVPEGPITPYDPIDMVIDMSTPGAAAFLYAPTDVVIDHPGRHVDVTVYLDSGTLAMIDHITEVVELGNASPGTYQYDVELIPGQPCNWGTRHVSGSFTVVPSPATIILLLSALPITIGLRRPRTRP